MEEGARAPNASASLPASLHELLASVGTDSVAHSQGTRPDAGPDGAAYLTVTLRGVRCLLPLDRLRGVLAEQPRVVPAPRAPRWLLGVFPYRAELLALVDPAPLLCDATPGAAGTAPPTGQRGAADGDGLPGAVVIVGSGERTLAWRVERAGVIVPAGAVAKAAADATHGAAPSDEPSIARAYVAFDIVGDAPDGPAAVLDVDAALNALLEALVEEDDHE